MFPVPRSLTAREVACQDWGVPLRQGLEDLRIYGFADLRIFDVRCSASFDIQGLIAIIVYQ